MRLTDRNEVEERTSIACAEVFGNEGFKGVEFRCQVVDVEVHNLQVFIFIEFLRDRIVKEFRRVHIFRQDNIVS